VSYSPPPCSGRLTGDAFLAGLRRDGRVRLERRLEGALGLLRHRLDLLHEALVVAVERQGVFVSP